MSKYNIEFKIGDYVTRNTDEESVPMKVIGIYIGNRDTPYYKCATFDNETICYSTGLTKVEWTVALGDK